MNGKEICGKSTQARGPKHLVTPTTTSSPQATTDMKTITDCYYFILNGHCKPKQGQKCNYRHMAKLRQTSVVCEKWSARKCMNRKCPKLHPSFKSEAEASATTSATTPVVKKEKLQRCKSHNSFKCFGDCGDANCATHFETEDDLKEHISIQLKKSILREKCHQCNAVFFNEEEKRAHIHHKELNKNVAVSSTEITNVKAEPIGVFWDIENCQVPKGKSALSIVTKIRETFYPNRREVEFMCVCDTTKEKKEVLEELNSSQINIIHINATSKNAADDKLKQSLRRFAQAHKPPATIVLISGDINFASELSDLRHRHNLRVILLHNKQASSALLQCANDCYCFEDFTVVLPSSETSSDDSSKDSTKEIIVSNLPSGNRQVSNTVRQQLKLLVDNTGGKVVHVQLSEDDSKGGGTAIIRFANGDLARKAVVRLSNEEVLGSKVRARIKKNKPTTVTPQPAINKDSKKTTTPSRHGMQSLAKVGKSKSMMTLTHTGYHDVPGQLQSKPEHQTIFPMHSAVAGGMFGGMAQRPILPALMNALILPPNRFAPPLPPPLMSAAASAVIRQTHSPMSSTAKPSPAKPSPAKPSPAQTSQKNNNNKSTNNNADNAKHQDGGVKLLVTNLDESVDRDELQRSLATLINENCKVISLVVETGNNHNHAVVHLAKQKDADLCIAKLNNHKLFSKNLHVSVSSTKDITILKMKSLVSHLLKEPGWLPLNEFLLKFKECYKKALHVLDLDQIKDIIYVDGKPGNQFICLLHYNIGILFVKQDANFEKEVMEILQVHNRKIPFASLLGLYWSYTGKYAPVNDSGDMLVKLGSSPNICLAGSDPINQVIYYNKRKPNKGSKYPLDDFKNDMIQFLKVSPGFTVPFSRFAPLHHQFFGRQLTVGDYGYKDLASLLKAFPDVFEITEHNDSKSVSFTPNFKQILLTDTLTELVSGRDKHKLPLNSLLTAYYRYFGHKLYYRNYGYTTFLDLISSLKNKFKLAGVGETKMFVLCPQRKKPSQKDLKKFAEDVANLIQSKPEKQLSFHNLSSEFYKHYGRQLKLSEFGFAKLNDLVSAISDFVEIRGTRDQKILYMSDEQPEDFQSLWDEVDEIIDKTHEQCILGLKLPEIYENKLGKCFPLDAVKMTQFLKRWSSNSLVIGKGAHQIIIASNKANYPSKLLREQIAEIIYSVERFSVPLREIYTKLFDKGIIMNPSHRLVTEIKACEYFEITSEDCVRLLPPKCQKLFERDVIQLLYEDGEKLLLNHFAKTYTKKYHKVLKVSDYGVSKLMHLFDKITNGFVQVDHPASGGHPTVSLGRLGKLCMDCDSVMSDNSGSLLLCNFAPEYQRKFGVQLRPNDFCFTKIFELVECFSCVFKVYGEKNMRVVVQLDRILNPVVEVHSFPSADDMDSDSADSDVIVESEEVVSRKQDDIQQADLLRFHGIGDDDDGYQHSRQRSSEWWMDPIPYLPEPTLQPEQNHPVIEPAFDLISFTEFDNEDIRSGGIDNVHLPPPLIPNATEASSQLNARHKSSSDDFVDNLFNKDIEAETQEPDLMRLLVGRCSPVDRHFRKDIQLPPDQSISNDNMSSSISDTYSCFSSQPGTDDSGNSYSAALNNLHIGDRIFKPRIAANFNKI